MGGLFNIADPIFGQPMYLYGFGLLLMAAGLVHLAYRYGSWEKFRPLWGMYYAFKAKSKAAFIFNRRMHAELVSEATAKCIFDYKQALSASGPVKYNFDTHEYEPLSSSGLVGKIQGIIWYYPAAYLDIDWAHQFLYKLGGANHDVDIAKKMQKYLWDDFPSLHSGGILIDFVLDAGNWTIRTSPEHVICERLADTWNETNPEDQIHSYAKLQKYLLMGIIPAPEGLSVVENAPWTRVDAACPTSTPSNLFAGARRQQELDDLEKRKNPYGQYIPLMAFGGLGFAALILAVRMTIHYI